MRSGTIVRGLRSFNERSFNDITAGTVLISRSGELCFVFIGNSFLGLGPVGLMLQQFELFYVYNSDFLEVQPD